MVKKDKLIMRKGDMPNSFLEIMVCHDGDVFVRIKGNNSDGMIEDLQVQFCAPFGGGYHPRTLLALYHLAEAMEQDNKDFENPERYR